jgi:hypothetical protein
VLSEPRNQASLAFSWSRVVKTARDSAGSKASTISRRVAQARDLFRRLESGDDDVAVALVAVALFLGQHG